MAEYYGGSRLDPRSKKLITGLVQDHRLAQIKMEVAAGEVLGLEKMITTQSMYQHYTWGWSLVHFCMTSKKYRKKYEKYVKSLVGGRGVKHVPDGWGNKTVEAAENWRVFKQCLGLKNPDQVKKFEAEWHDYVKEGLKLVTPRGLELAAANAVRSGFKIKAKRLFKEALEAGTENALTYHRYASLLRREGQRDKAIELWRKAVELDPVEAGYYKALGEALIQEKQKDEGKRLLALAKELDPSIDID
jgi:tetratricopeptide (TPR) repeat protein